MLEVKLVKAWDSFLNKTQQHHLRTLMIQGGDKEVCGVIFEHDIIVQYQNISPEPELNFAAEFDIGDRTIKAIWHSHPRGPAAPSAKDIKFMEMCEQEGLRLRHLIVCPEGVLEMEVKLVDTSTSAA